MPTTTFHFVEHLKFYHPLVDPLFQLGIENTGWVAWPACHYKRAGTANVFCGVTILGRTALTKSTVHRCSLEFVDYLLERNKGICRLVAISILALMDRSLLPKPECRR